MLDSDVSSITDKLAALQAEFHQELPATIAEIRQQWTQLCQREISRDDMVSLHIMVHGLTGKQVAAIYQLQPVPDFIQMFIILL